MNAAMCAGCGGESGVYDSRPNGVGIHRRRKCEACGLRWTTTEIRDGDLQRVKKASAALAAAKALVAALEDQVDD